MTLRLQQFNYDTPYSPYAWWLLAGNKLFGSVLVVGELPDDDLRVIEGMASRLDSADINTFAIETNGSLSKKTDYDAIIINSNQASPATNPAQLLKNCNKFLISTGMIVMYVTEYPVYRHALSIYPNNTDILPCISYNHLPFEAFVPGRYHTNKNQCVARDRIKTILYNTGVYRLFLDSSILIRKNKRETNGLLDDILGELSKKLPGAPDKDNINISKYYFRYGKLIASFSCISSTKQSRYIVVIVTDRLALIQRENEKSVLAYIRNIKTLARYAVDFYIETAISGFRAYIMDEADGVTVDATCANIYSMTLNASRVIESLATETLRHGRDLGALNSKLSLYISQFNKKMYRYGSGAIYPVDQVIYVLKELPVVFMHGDMKLENFVLDSNNNVNKIIDWEQSDIEGWLLLDLLYLISYDMHIVDEMDFNTAFINLYNNDVSITYKDMLLSYRKKFNISDYQYRILLAIFFLHHYSCRVIVESMSEQDSVRYKSCLDMVNTILHGD